MWKAFLILIPIIILSWIITYYYEKYKVVAKFWTYLGIAGALLSAIQFITGYNPLEALKEDVSSIIFESNNNTESKAETTNKVKNEENVDVPEVSDTAAPAIQVKVPDETNSPAQTEEVIETVDAPYSNQSNKAVFFNVRESMRRDADGIIHIAWTPMLNQDIYKLKVEIDDQFSNIDTNQEFLCKNSWYDIDLSECTPDTVIFISIGVYNEDSSDWVYTKTSFILY